MANELVVLISHGPTDEKASIGFTIVSPASLVMNRSVRQSMYGCCGRKPSATPEQTPTIPVPLRYCCDSRELRPLLLLPSGFHGRDRVSVGSGGKSAQA